MSRTTLRDHVLAALDDLGVCVGRNELAAYLRAKLGAAEQEVRMQHIIPLAEREIGAYRRDPGAREVWICHPLTARHLETMWGIFARSDWPLEWRIETMRGGQIRYLKRVIRLCELAAATPDVADPLAARTRDGAIHLALRDLCETLSLALPAQRRRIQANESLHLIQLRVQVGRQFRTMDFLLLDDVPVWIMDVQSRRVGEEVRERFGYIKSYLVSAVQAAFAQLTGLPEGPSQQIEDIRDLDRIDQALRTLEQLNTRQTTIEASQDRARIAFRDLAAMVRSLQSRVQTLEQQAKQRMSPSQRGTIYHLVQAWGTALAARTPEKKPGASIRSRWQIFNDRFNLGTYTDLPAARYDEAIQFIKEQYRGLTGQEIDAIEQSGLEFDE